LENLWISQSKFIFGEVRAKTRHSSYTNTLCAMQRKPTHIQAHLVFADTQANAEKPKELEISEAIHEHQ